MLYRPNKKEIKQIKELNNGYNLLRKGFAIIIKNTPRNDGEISIYAYRASKSIDKMVKRVAHLLEAQYVTKEFFNIVNNMKIKKRKKK